MGKKFKLKRLLRLNYKIKRIVRLYNPFVGATGGIRTPDLPVRSRTLYPAKLLVQDTTIIILNILKIFNRKLKKNLQSRKKYAIIYKQFVI